MVALINLLAAAWGIGIAIGVSSGPVPWPRADPIPHVFDVAGPLSDGRFVVAAAGKLFVMNQVTGAREAFAAGPGGYPGAGGEEPYIAVVSAPVASHSAFQPDDVFVLQLKPAGGVLRIDMSGLAHQFANVAGVDSLWARRSRPARSATDSSSPVLTRTGPRSPRSTATAGSASSQRRRRPWKVASLSLHPHSESSPAT